MAVLKIDVVWAVRSARLAVLDAAAMIAVTVRLPGNKTKERQEERETEDARIGSSANQQRKGRRGRSSADKRDTHGAQNDHRKKQLAAFTPDLTRREGGRR